MEIKQIKDLMHSMGKMGISRLVIKNDTFELELERGGKTFVSDAMSASLPLEQRTLDRGSFPMSEASGAKENGKFVKSPMVGTFYSAPSPEDPQFIKVGDEVNESTVVCIVEAMKVMNEVKAGVSGTITKVLVESGHPVEFGTKLFMVE